MLFDTENMFSDDQAITTSAVSTNLIDLGVAGTPVNGNQLVRDVGPGTPIEILIQNVVAAGGTTPTIQVDLEMDTDSGFGGATVIASSATLSAAGVGDRLSIVYVPDGATEQFLRLSYTTGGTSPTHTVTAGVTFGRQTPKA